MTVQRFKKAQGLTCDTCGYHLVVDTYESKVFCQYCQEIKKPK